MAEDLNPPAADEIVLRECPFCSGDAWVVASAISTRQGVMCRLCGATGGLADDNQEAITAWNTRTPPDLTELMGRQAREIAGLRAIVEVAVDEHDDHHGRVKDDSPHWSRRARALLAQSEGEG